MSAKSDLFILQADVLKNLFSITRIPLLLIVVICLCLTSSQAQVGIGILQPDSSAVLHLEANDRGFLPPRLTATERDAISDPIYGLTIFNTTDSIMQYFNGECWLATFQRNCDDCFIDLSATSVADTIDRIISNAVSVDITVDQATGTPQDIAFTIIGTLPPDMTYDFSTNPINNSGTTTLTISTSLFTPAGTYPIIVQAVCGISSLNFIYTVTVLPCYEVFVNNNTDNYNLGTDFYANFPAVPMNEAVCVISYVNPGVTVSSGVTDQPAYTTGNLANGSIVAIVNNGNIIGKGGDGGVATDPISGITGEGEDGGTAIDLTVNTEVYNNFNIFGGGGGGNAMAFAISQDVGPVTLGIFLGSGGGGGAGEGLGGANPPNPIGLSFYENGTDGTGGPFGAPGQGGNLTQPINIPVGPVNINLTPSVNGGNGGTYGFPGTQGTFDLSLEATINLGPFPIPIGPFNIPIPVPPPDEGDGGFAIKRNGNTTNIPDNAYNTAFLKGQVGN